jgi:hypothetical protein
MATEPRTVARLLEVDGDIGVALLPYLGAGASRLTSLNREHLRLSGEVLLAAELHDDLRAQAALNALSGHADQIAIFLSDQNPYWLLPEMRSLLGAQDALFVHLVKARLRSDWHDEIRAFDAFSRHALDTADVLTEGIAAQHPTLLTADPVGCGGGPSAAGDELRSRLRSLWLKHVIWGRHVLLSVASSPDMPDLEALRVRLLGSLDDMGIVFRPYFDDASADAFDRLARAHVDAIVDLFLAAREKDAAGLDAARRVLLANVDALATLVAGEGKTSSAANLRASLRRHVSTTVAALRGDIAGTSADVLEFDRIMGSSLGVGDALSEALVRGRLR